MGSRNRNGWDEHGDEHDRRPVFRGTRNYESPLSQLGDKFGDVVTTVTNGECSETRTPSLPPSREAPAAAPDLVSEGWASESLWRQSRRRSPTTSAGR